MCVSFAGHQQCSISAHESFALPPQMKEFPRRPDASAVNESIPLFYIGQNWKGAWVVREAEGRSGGLFLFKQSAVRFARRQCEPAGCAIMFLVEPVELDLDNEGRWAVPLSTIKKAPQASLVSQLIHAAVGVWRKIIVVVSHNVAALKRNRAAAERELFGGRYTLSSKNDDDLPIVR
jgi:hypothetical protein